MFEVLFWICLFAMAYHYAGYPLLLIAMGWIFRVKPIESSQVTPSVSLIISAYNEEGVIREKIQNALALDYPDERIQVIVASDGSTDRTCEIVRQFEDRGVVLHHHPDRRGKNEALNDVASQTTGEILVFTDANGMYRHKAIRHLVKPFADERVGCVCGELLYQNPNENLVAEGYNHYWRYDQWLKRLETQLHSLLGSNGSIFAVRRDLNRPIDPRVSNDMMLPIQVAADGYAVLYVPEAVSVESGSTGASEELRRRSRIVARGLVGTFFALPGLIRKGKILLLLQLVSRKLLRYFFPVFLISLFVSNGFLFASSEFYRWTLFAQFAPYLLVPLGYIFNRFGQKAGILSLPYYFCVGNLAAMRGICKALAFRNLATWEGFDRSYDLVIREGSGADGRD